MYLGTVIAMPLAGILAEYINWESIFYVFGRQLKLYFLSFLRTFVMMIIISTTRILGSPLVWPLVVDRRRLSGPGSEHH